MEVNYKLSEKDCEILRDVYNIDIGRLDGKLKQALKEGNNLILKLENNSPYCLNELKIYYFFDSEIEKC